MKLSCVSYVSYVLNGTRMALDAQLSHLHKQSSAHRACLKRHARCIFKFARASRMPKKARAMHYQFHACIAHVQKGTCDASSISRAHRSCLKRHARCTINFARASRMPKKALAMHHQIRARIAHAQKGMRDAPSISRTHRACPKRHARCTFNVAALGITYLAI